MTTARPRLSALPFPTVSVLTIYTTAPIPSEPHPPPNDSSNDQKDHGEGEKEDEQVAEMRKVVYWYSQHGNDLPVERKARLMGTIRGMSDFARSVHQIKARWRAVERRKLTLTVAYLVQDAERAGWGRRTKCALVEAEDGLVGG